jgi:heterotetrameric sarcosine oxidase gamma subunit
VRADPTDIAVSAFAGLPARVGSGEGVLAIGREGLGIARIVARRGEEGRLAELTHARLGVVPANAPRRVCLGEVAIAGIAPGTWLATREHAGNAFAVSLQSLLAPCASVCDQSDAYAILRLGGPQVRAALSKLVPIDLHPRSFEVNQVAQTLCGYLSVTLWRLEDDALRAPTFEIWTARSLAVSLHEALSSSAAEFGFVLRTEDAPEDAGRPFA